MTAARRRRHIASSSDEDSSNESTSPIRMSTISDDEEAVDASAMADANVDAILASGLQRQQQQHQQQPKVCKTRYLGHRRSYQTALEPACS